MDLNALLRQMQQGGGVSERMFDMKGFFLSSPVVFFCFAVVFPQPLSLSLFPRFFFCCFFPSFFWSSLCLFPPLFVFFNPLTLLLSFTPFFLSPFLFSSFSSSVSLSSPLLPLALSAHRS